MTTVKQLHWPLILGMGALALLQPVLHFTGVMDALGRPRGPLLAGALVTLAWLLIVGLAPVRAPVLTLTCTGLVYGVVSLLISATLAPPGTGPTAHPAAIVAVVLLNTLWGALIGLAARALRAARRRHTH